MNAQLVPLLLVFGFLLLGWGLGVGWQTVVRAAFESSGAQIQVSIPTALFEERLFITLATASIVPFTWFIRAVVIRIAGRSLWPVWVLLIVLLLGESLSIGLRLIALATIDLPRLVSEAASQGVAPTIDLSTTALGPWSFAGVVGAAVISLGILIAFGLINPAEAANVSTKP